MNNDILLRTIKGENTERVPVWLMRQAGRILPQYRAVREKLSGFKELVETPDLACEVTIQPVDELGVDAAIIFSDILVVCDAMGLPYDMEEKRGPYFKKTLRSLADIQNLRIADGNDNLRYTIDAVRLTKKALNGRVPLIGFAAAPWTLLAYMVEGSGSKTFAIAKKMLYAEPQLAHAALEKIAQSTVHYLKAQIKAGADVVQVFDSWAGILSPEQYSQFSAKYIRYICEAIDEVPVTVFAKGAFFALEEIAAMPCQTIGLDWNTNPQFARQMVGNHKILQGNLDPCQLYAQPEAVEQATIKMLQDFGGKRHIANLGHGVYPDTPLENVKIMVNTVKNYR
jgi:uroporphyrinogen decarboxylase